MRTAVVRDRTGIWRFLLQKQWCALSCAAEFVSQLHCLNYISGTYQVLVFLPIYLNTYFENDRLLKLFYCGVQVLRILPVTNQKEYFIS